MTTISHSIEGEGKNELNNIVFSVNCNCIHIVPINSIFQRFTKKCIQGGKRLRFYFDRDSLIQLNLSSFCFLQKATGAAGGAIPRRRNGKVFLGRLEQCFPVLVSRSTYTFPKKGKRRLLECSFNSFTQVKMEKVKLSLTLHCSLPLVC